MFLRKKKEGEGGKVLRKKKKPEEDEDGATVRSLKKKKKNVAEIDGVLWALDDDGNPTKRLRKKKKPGEEDEGDEAPAPKKTRPRRFKSETALDDSSSRKQRGRGIIAGQKISRRAKSLGRDQAEQEQERPRRRAQSAPGKARTYTDPKGRKVVIDEGGKKTVFDKNGKKLRKKGEKDKEEVAAPPSPPPREELKPAADDDDATADDFLSGLNDDAKRESNMFDSLWDDEMTKAYGTPNGPEVTVEDAVASVRRETEANTSLSSKISEVGKENKELQIELSVAEEAIQNLTEQNKKEKSKNLKAMTQVMQLKADFTESISELQALRSKSKDMKQTLDQKDRDIESLGGAGSYGEEKKNDGSCEACATMKEENTILQETIGAEKATFEKDSKQKDDRINFLTIELDTIMQELEAMINGDKGGPSNPTMVGLLDFGTTCPTYEGSKRT
jgi:hypothetical protein